MFQSLQIPKKRISRKMERHESISHDLWERGTWELIVETKLQMVMKMTVRGWSKAQHTLENPFTVKEDTGPGDGKFQWMQYFFGRGFCVAAKWKSPRENRVQGQWGKTVLKPAPALDQTCLGEIEFPIRLQEINDALEIMSAVWNLQSHINKILAIYFHESWVQYFWYKITD